MTKFGDITLRREGDTITVTHADEYAYVAAGLIKDAVFGLKIDGDRMTVGTDDTAVTYEITGYDAQIDCHECKRLHVG